MFRKVAITFGLLAALSITYSAISKEVKLDGVKCPVSGKPAKNVDGSVVKHNGGDVYMCCAGCPGAFKKDTAKFTAKANLQMVQTGQFKQVKCPLKGKPVNKSLSVDVAGVKVGVC